MIQKIGNINTILSLLIAVVTLAQWLLKVPLQYILLTIILLILIWIGTVLYLICRVPWHKQFRSPILKLWNKTYTYDMFYQAVFKHPFYEINYISPTIENQTSTTYNMDKKIITEKITVIIEDDPVGYMEHKGSIPAFAIEDNTTATMLYNDLLESKELIIQKRIFFIATPSRRLDKDKSFSLNKEIGTALKKFMNHLSIDFRIISKVDSCLRSNYESEFLGLKEGFRNFSIEIFVPSYIEQGRITMHGSQYLYIDNRIVPLHESEYSQFKGLEFNNSNLALWLEKRCRHIQSRKNVGLLDIDVIRSESAEEICQRISNRPSCIKAFVCDSSEEDDLNHIFNICTLLETNKERIFYKLGPSMINRLVQEYIDNENENTLSCITAQDKGIFVTGSLSSKTKEQIANLRDEAQTSIVLISNEEIEYKNETHIIQRKSRKIIEKNERGDNVILTTEFWLGTGNEYPNIKKRDLVLHYFAEICKNVKDANKRWFLLKGSDTALYTMIHGFDIHLFYYCGQIIPGVIHCKCLVKKANGMKSFFIVGGNVGNDELLINFGNYINKITDDTEKKNKTEVSSII